MPAKPLDRYLHFGFATGRGPQLFEAFHRHNEIELLFVERGRLTFLFGRGREEIRAGGFAVFWGAMPHKLIAIERGSQSHWLTVPLAWFLQWDLPAPLASVLKGALLREPDSKTAPAELERFKQWHADLASPAPERRKVVLLEVEARLRRLAQTLAATRAPRRSPAVAAGVEGRVERLSVFVAAHYREPLRVAEIAAAAGLNPEYATTLFRRTLGLSLVEYLTEHRISHAQRLLTTTDRKVLDIALDAGFGSLSRFYEAFTAACGVTPRKFRAQHRAHAEN